MADESPRRAPKRVVVLLSGSGSLLQALLDDTSPGVGPGVGPDVGPGVGADAIYRVVAVVSDRDDAFGLQRARGAGVATASVRLADFADRDEWDLGLTRAVAVFSPDLVVMAGFMKICGPRYLERFGAISINSHPALLPAFPGAHGVRDALAHGVKVTGCSVILVDAGTDSGPIIGQRSVEVLDEDTEETLHERIKGVERGLLVELVRALCAQGWQVEGRRVLIGASTSSARDVSSRREPAT